MQDLERIGPYVLSGLLGQGRSSQVWGAEDERDGSLWALKVAPAGAAAERVRHEAAVLARLQHPHVLRCREAGESDGLVWMVTPRMAPWPGLPALVDFRALLAALSHVHEAGLLHCDVKTANLLQGPDGALVLADFGLARLADHGPGPAHGTPHVMPPEQLRGRALAASADVFAAGVLLYAVLTGTRPFSGTAFEVVQQILHDEPAPPSMLSDAVAPAFDALIARALAKQPGARYPDAGAFLIDFDAACQLSRLR